MGFEPMLPLSNTNGLANRPLQPLEYFSILLVLLSLYFVSAASRSQLHTQVCAFDLACVSSSIDKITS